MRQTLGGYCQCTREGGSRRGRGWSGERRWFSQLLRQRWRWWSKWPVGASVGRVTLGLLPGSVVNRCSGRRADRRVDGVLEICALALAPASRAALPENATLVFATLLDGVPAEGSIWVVLACRCRTRVARVGIRLERRPTGSGVAHLCERRPLPFALLFFKCHPEGQAADENDPLRVRYDLFAIIRYIEIQS